MGGGATYRIGTSGYSFDDWVGRFYPPGTARADMFAFYLQHFCTVELNFTYYRMPPPRTLESLAASSPEGFDFWVKANQRTTHRQDRTAASEFVANLAPLTQRGKLAGVLMQFPQSFHRTVVNREYLQATIEDFAAVPLAVEFRHASWQHPSVVEGLAERRVSLVVPDVPAIDSLFHAEPVITGPCGYLRLHSRNAGKWYAKGADRYDYTYSDNELRELLHRWSPLEQAAPTHYVFCNNCHGGQAARNALRLQQFLAE